MEIFVIFREGIYLWYYDDGKKNIDDNDVGVDNVDKNGHLLYYV